MLLQTLVGAVSLFGTAVEAAPQGFGFGKLRRDGRYSYGNMYKEPDVYTPVAAYTPPDTNTKLAGYYPLPKNTSTSAINIKTLEPAIQCPTNGVYVSTKTVDVTITVTASPNVAYVPVYNDYTKTLTVNGTIYVPGGKHVYTQPYEVETRDAYPEPEATGNYPVNSNYLPPHNTKAPDGTDGYPYMNSTIAASFTTPIDKHAYETNYQYPNQTAVYNTPSGYKSAAPVYTKPVYPGSENSSIVAPVYTKPVYPHPSGNSTAAPVYITPSYTRPIYSDPLVSGNSSALPPIFTPPAYPSVYTPPAYTKAVYTPPILPGNSSVIDLPVYTKPGQKTPIYTMPAYSDPATPSNSSIVAPDFTPPSYTKPVYSGPENSSIGAPVNTKGIDTPIYTPPAYTKPVYSDPAASSNSSVVLPVYTEPVKTPIYTPPFNTKVPFPSESSESAELPFTSAAANSTVAPVIPVYPERTPVASTSQNDAVSASVTQTPSGTTTDLDCDTETLSTPATSIYETPSLARTPAAASTTETCVIDSSMAPIATSYQNTTATTMYSAPTETSYDNNLQNRAPKRDSAHCGVNGEAAGLNFLAEFSENKNGVAVTLEGCYQFCEGNIPSTRGCQAYRFYQVNGSPRCALYRASVSASVSTLDVSVESRWYDSPAARPPQVLHPMTKDSLADYQQLSRLLLV
ncbi:hypothetical protein NM208_g9422 [Fusarium decemcellulare]|uniref:Uncharacterized protein n=1 Tax=Fusarium decemcellulare TaxID=57161 RepID=A0ACC1S1N7_9HYPO|nr:hypothetical protein NM208_g9422 [Fusarium decemcellulare]